jgi:hypothetical protein
MRTVHAGDHEKRFSSEYRVPMNGANLSALCRVEEVDIAVVEGKNQD